MKNKKYTSICDLLTKQLKRKFFPFNDFDDVNRFKNNNLYQFPIKQYYNQKRRVNDRTKKMLWK